MTRRTIAPIKSVRLPKKPGAVSSSSHRGFGFVEFARKEDAKACYTIKTVYGIITKFFCFVCLEML